jgi:hypothetical protein
MYVTLPDAARYDRDHTSSISQSLRQVRTALSLAKKAICHARFVFRVCGPRGSICGVPWLQTNFVDVFVQQGARLSAN